MSDIKFNTYLAGYKEEFDYLPKICDASLDGSDDVPYFSGALHGFRSVNVIFACHDKDLMVGALVVHVGEMTAYGHSDNDLTNWVSSVGVAPSHRGLGISKELIDMMFRFAKKHHLAILQSSYTKMGKERVMKAFDEASSRYPDVKWIDKKEDF